MLTVFYTLGIFSLTIFAICNKQQEQPQNEVRTTYSPIYIESWQKGNQLIREQVLSVELSMANKEYKENIKNIFGENSYHLYIQHESPSLETSSNYESWQVNLYKIKKKKASRYNTLKKEKPTCLVGDFFPIEDYIGRLYPLKQPVFAKHGILAYPFLAKRIIKIEGFFCLIQVTDYKFNKENSNTLDFVKVKIVFTNKHPLTEELVKPLQ